MTRSTARLLAVLACALLSACGDSGTDANPHGDGGNLDAGSGGQGQQDGAVGADAASTDGAAGDAGACDGPCSPPPTAVEVPGPSATLFAEHPYYTCVENRYVATAANGGSDSADGMAATVGGGHGPWLTLQHANDAIPKSAPGYCINIGDGSYTLDADLDLDRGGTEASKTGFTVWRAQSLLGAKLIATANVSDIIHAQVPYLVFDGLELDGGHFAKSNHGIDTCFNAFDYNGIHHVFVLDSYIHHMGGNGVANCWADYYWVIHNRLDENAYNSWNSGISTYEPIEIPGYTPTAFDAQWTPYHNVYAYNRCYGNFTSPAGGPHTDGNGIEYDDSRHEQQAPNVAYAPRALVMGNVAWGNGGFGIHIGPTSSNADVFNNTAYDNGLDTLNDGTWRGEFSSAFGSGNVFRNNVGFAVPGSGILKNNTPFLGGSPVDGSNEWTHNIAFGNAPHMEGADSFPTPDNKVDTDPQLADPQGSNFALNSGSPAIGFGALVPHWQQQTPGGIDVGACPHQLTACP